MLIYIYINPRFENVKSAVQDIIDFIEASMIYTLHIRTHFWRFSDFEPSWLITLVERIWFSFKFLSHTLTELKGRYAFFVCDNYNDGTTNADNLSSYLEHIKRLVVSIMAVHDCDYQIV